ncbi:MAG: exosortase system-associated protein, TIGR04073 family [Candidatus Omnitrophota bacterium]|nr:exosortase system-associated protein, TIGR04073 family [Candidatus Omnitrophota bacterium]
MKMKKAVLVLFAAVVFSCSTVYAATDDFFAGMGRKFTRGLVNVLTGWVELPMQTIKGYNRGFCGDENNKIGGSTCGFFKGIGHTIGRTAWGAVELVGFWTANPEDNLGIGIPLDAEYAWEEGEPHDCCNPDFTEATIRPISKKFLRGLGNSLFGFAELPGQIAKGFQEGAFDLGVGKGLWFWYSREIYGIADLATLIFPVPEENAGYRFDEEYPWDALADVMEE